LTKPKKTVPPEGEDEEAVYNSPSSVLLRSLSGSARIIVDVWARSHRPPPPDTHLVSDILNTIVHGIQTGQDFSSTYPTIARLIHKQEDRANLVNQLMLVDDFRRAALFMDLRNELENELILASRSDTLTSAERLVLLKMADDRLKETRGSIAGNAMDVQDVVGLLQKANYALEVKGEAVKQQFIKTSPQGREIIRKLMTTMSRRMKDSEKSEKNDGLP
jgi:hypothetical protein